MKLLLFALLFLSVVCFPGSASSEDLTTLSGKTYRNARVSTVEPDGVTYFFDGGAVKIPFSDLSEVIRKKYGYSAQRAAAFAAQDDALQQKLAADREAELAAERSRQAATTVADSSMKTLQAAVERLKQAKPPPGFTSKPGEQILRVRGTVLQTLSGGVILTDWENCTLEPYGDRDGSTTMDTQLFVAGTPETLIDGGRFKGVVYPAGVFRYTSVTGAVKTIYRYAVSPELAVQLQSAGN